MDPLVSQAHGAGDGESVALAFQRGLVIALLVSIPLMGVWTVTGPALVALGQDEKVAELAQAYLLARLPSALGFNLFIAMRQYLAGRGITRPAMWAMLVSNVLNIFLNWVLIFGNLGAPELGAAGAGVASAIATVFGAASYFVLGRSYARDAGFLHGLPSRETMATIIRLAAPAGLQQFFFAAGMTVFLMLVARMGTPELAATKVIIDLMLVGILPGIGFGLAAASLAGQALGRGNAEDAKQWGWDVTKMAVLVVGALSIPAVLVPEWLLSGFIHEPSTLALAKTPLRLVAGFLFLDSVGMVLMNALIGAGDTKRVMFIGTSFQWLVFLPAVYVIGPVMGLGLVFVFAAQVFYRGFQSLTFALMWRGGRWQSIEIQ